MEVSMPDRPIVDFDHNSREFAETWPEMTARIRADCPVAFSERYGGFWVISRYEDVVRLARDYETFASGGEGLMIPGTASAQQPATTFLEMDPPEQTKWRQVLSRYFAPAAVDLWRPRIQELIDEALDAVIETGRMNLVHDFATRVPALFTMEFVGMPPEQAYPLADVFHLMTYTPPTSPDWERVHAGTAITYKLVGEVAARRRVEPQDDLITALVNVNIDGVPLTDEQVAATGGFIVGAGVDTTTSLFANAAFYLHRNHAARERLIEVPELIPIATEEFLRFHSVVPDGARTATRDVWVGDQFIRKGDRVLLLWSSANHDETEFDKPEEFIPDRSPNRHAAFAHGVHRCLGSNFARVEFQMMLAELLRRMPDYEVIEEETVPYETIGTVNGYVEMPARFTPGQAPPNTRKSGGVARAPSTSGQARR
jgi:cytochrome P450